MALTISSVVNKKCYFALFARTDICKDRYAVGLRALIWTVTPSVVSKRPACTVSLVALIEAEGSVSDNGPFGSGNRLKYQQINAFVLQR